ncbi:MotE family protein [Desulfolutivibrio sulfoxidireducens]|uniref:MotE family protein n=1 Tax=Desulfolutivibrio sulfoxidireducens TaxID=2773299 RepID=UPI00159EAEE0|nr:hypothetical protein [Desulfolutivibrio sulfoxidireducens]QLA17939.1 hypothetical protein GD605_18535 [Desulfolutivibrio sulfoxidireducens]QLA21516.1 hypothetical protein GD604_18150 [Desulfolutivibrio sulfoxidireducens]
MPGLGRQARHEARRLGAAPRLSKVLTALVFLAAIKLGVLLFLGIDALVPETVRQEGHTVVASVMGVPKALAQTPKPDEPKPAPAEKQAGPPGVLDWQELAKRKEELDRRERAISDLESKLDQRVKELAALEATLKTMLDQAQQTKDEKLRHLIDVYTNMKPKQAAAVLETLDERIAVKILAGMKGRQAGEILTGVSAKKAATLSEQLTKMQLPPEMPEPGMAPGQ